MRKRLLLLVAMLAPLLIVGGTALADGPSGSTECHLSDDDCDGQIDEDPVDGADNDGDEQIDEDPPGDAADDPGENQVTCASGTATPVGVIFVGGSGAEVCNDGGGAIPLEGRIIATTDQGGYVSGDGDNTSAEPANGYARIDGGGVHCGNVQNQDSTADQSNNTSADCG